MKNLGKKDVGPDPVPGRSKMNGGKLLEENKKLRRRLNGAIAKLKTAKEDSANQSDRLSAENLKLRQQLSEARSKLKAANDRSAELQENLEVAFQKIEDCTKIFAKKTSELNCSDQGNFSYKRCRSLVGEEG